MKFRVFALVVALALLPGPAISAEDVDRRAFWVQPAGLQSPEAVHRTVAAAAASGATILFVPIDARSPEFDALAETIAAARARGMRVHASFDVNLVSSASGLPPARDHVVYRHPEWLMVPRALAPELLDVDVRSPEYLGRLARWTRAHAARLDGLYVSPLHTGVHAQLAAAVTQLVTRYAVDGVHFDHARYPGADFDYSRAALAAFRTEMRTRLDAAELARLDAIAAIDPFAWVEELPTEWRLFRQTQMTALVTRLRSAAKSVRPQIVVSAAVVPDAAAAAREAFQDWRTWIDNGFVDALSTPAESAFIRDVRALAGSAPVWLRD